MPTMIGMESIAPTPFPDPEAADLKSPGKSSRLDADHPRSRLLLAALRLFAQHGYAKTSVRDLAQAASVNVAAVSYYFGDKAALYRAVFVEPMGADAEHAEQPCGPPGLPLREALDCFYAGMLDRQEISVSALGVLAADTTVVLDGRILGKPADHAEAFGELVEGLQHFGGELIEEQVEVTEL